jgi:hypothetical protein
MSVSRPLTTSLCYHLVQERDISVTEWPPQSPDLNPIKNFSAAFKEAFHNHFVEMRIKEVKS